MKDVVTLIIVMEKKTVTSVWLLTGSVNLFSVKKVKRVEPIKNLAAKVYNIKVPRSLF